MKRINKVQCGPSNTYTSPPPEGTTGGSSSQILKGNYYIFRGLLDRSVPLEEGLRQPRGRLWSPALASKLIKPSESEDKRTSDVVYKISL